MAFGAKRIAGLDVGQTATKAIVLEKQGGSARVVKCLSFRNRDEGLMDQTEVADHLSVWLREQGVADNDFVVGLPQYMAMTQLTDFPPVKGAQLDDLVAYETQQLAGLTDEVFIHDHQELQPFFHYDNPVLLGVCREAMIENRLSVFTKSNLKLDRMCLDGQALLATYLDQRREAAAADELVLLLDIGAENTTMVLVLGDQAVYYNSFLFGGDFFTEQLSRHLGVSEIEAEKTKFGSRLDPADPQSPLTVAAQTFVMELEAALDNWRNHDPKSEQLKIGQIHLSGSGGSLEGFDEFLRNNYHCDVARLSVPGVTAAGEDPNGFNIVYGLALIGLRPGRSKAALNLLPAEQRWVALRRKRIGYLYAALLMLTLLGAAYLVLTFLSLRKEREELVRRTRRLEMCEKIMPGLLGSKESIDHYDVMLQPFAARGNRNMTVVRAVDQLSQTKQSNNWIYLLADYPASYHGKQETFKLVNGNNRVPFPLGGNPISRTPAILASSVQPWEAIAISGFTPKERELKDVRESIRLLNDSKLFTGVDANPRMSPMDAQLRKEWLMFRMKWFSLICPLETVEFKLPEATNGGAR